MQGNLAQESNGNLAGAKTDLDTIAAAVAGGKVKVDVSGTAANATAIKVDNSGVTQPTNTAQVAGSAVATAATGVQKVGLTDGSGNPISSTGTALDINIKSGGSGGTQYANGSAQATPTGTVALGYDSADVRALKTDASGNLNIVGNVASGTADSGNPVKVGSKYNATPPTLSDGQRADLQSDVNGNLKVTLATEIAGEDIPNNKLIVEQRNVYSNVTATGTTTVKSGANFLHGLIINNPSAITSATTGTTITLYDNTTASSPKIGTITLPPSANLAGALPFPIPYNVSINTGLTIVITVGSGGSWTPDITINTRS